MWHDQPIDQTGPIAPRLGEIQAKVMCCRAAVKPPLNHQDPFIPHYSGKTSCLILVVFYDMQDYTEAQLQPETDDDAAADDDDDDDNDNIEADDDADCNSISISTKWIYFDLCA